MYNSVRLTEEDAYVQCFLWRDLDATKEASTHQVLVNNIGVKPAGAIATLALQNSAEVFSNKYPLTTDQLIKKSYVDDIGLTEKTLKSLKLRTKDADVVLEHANMYIKRWTYSGDMQASDVTMGEAAEVVLSSENESERMLGIIWNPRGDFFRLTCRC